MAESGCGCGTDAAGIERRTLAILLGINAAMFVVEAAAGWWSESTGLMADSLDMFADASVYGIALYAAVRGAATQLRAAFISGVLQMTMAIGILADVARRAVGGSDPESAWMIGTGAAALAANLACLRLLYSHRHGPVHMRASWIFSTNDVLVNAGVIISGVLVGWLASPLPDLVIGSVIGLLVLKGGLRILAEVRREAAVSL